jgi:hypothetical protein
MKLQPYELRAISLALKSLESISKRLNRLDCANCNGEITEELWDKKTYRLIEKANKIAEAFEMFAYHQSDPRGVSLYLLAPEIVKDKFGYVDYTQGFCVI